MRATFLRGPRLLACYTRVPGYSNALYALQPDKMVWTQPSVFCAEGSAAPVARLGATATALHAHAALLLFGAQVSPFCVANP